MIPKVLKLYNSIVERDQKGLSDFIFSKFSNLSNEAQALYKYLKSSSDKEYDKREAWKKIYGGKKFNDPKLRKVNFELTRALERYISICQLDRNELLNRTIFNQYLFENNAKGMLSKVHSDLQKQIDLSENYSLKKLFYDFLNEEFLYNISSQKSLVKSDNIDKLKLKLKKYYYAEYLRVLLKEVSLQSIKSGVIIEEINTSLSLVPQELILSEPIIQAFVLCVRSYVERENVELYQELMDFLRVHGDDLDDSVLEDVFRSGANFGIYQTNKGNTEFYTEVVALYILGIERGALLSQGELNLNIFKNAVTLLLKARMFDDALEFSEKYSPFLNPKIRENERAYSLGQIYFYKKEFALVLKKLLEVEITDINYDLSSKTLMAATYYELGEFIVLRSFLDSFRVMLSRRKDKISSDRSARYKNFVQFLDQIVKIGKTSPSKLKIIEEKVQKTTNITNKRWLLEKISENLN